MSYTTGCHTIFHHRYHIVWTPKYRHKILRGEIRERVRTIVRQVCKEMGVTIVRGVLSTNHVHMFVEIPPHIAVLGTALRKALKASSPARSYRRQPVVVQCFPYIHHKNLTVLLTVFLYSIN